jgi:poly-beta-hydroxyalkanoate depolymerase
MIIYLGGRKYPVASAGEASPADMERNLYHEYGLTTRLETFFYLDTLDGYIQFRQADETKTG